MNEYGRPGHIPGAKNVSAWAILDKASGRYRPLGELREMCAPALGAERVITYCGGGIAASSLAFVLHRLGHPNVAVYDGGCSNGAPTRHCLWKWGTHNASPNLLASGNRVPRLWLAHDRKTRPWRVIGFHVGTN